MKRKTTHIIMEPIRFARNVKKKKKEKSKTEIRAFRLETGSGQENSNHFILRAPKNYKCVTMDSC